MQSYRNHRRANPLVHYILTPILVANIVVAGRAFVRAPNGATAWVAVMAIALLLLLLTARSQVLIVQNRLIRLEMRLRLAAVLAPELLARSAALQTRQLVGLRFASDAELPALVERCLAGQLTTTDAIKREVRDWQPDFLRA